MSLTIGADPELGIRLNGTHASARRFFKSNSSFGLDGCDSTAELRPGYSESPLDLTAKIRLILESGHQRYPELEFISGHMVDGYSVGGHIHLSATPTDQLIANLDSVLGTFSDCLDDLDQREQRRECGYGKKGAYRRKQYGFEYRVPGSWLLSPSTTLVTLTLARLTAINEMVDFNSINKLKQPCEFLRSFQSNLHTIPDDCQEGLLQLQLLLNSNRPNWDVNILPNWGLWRDAA
ncbi:hypothetical protein ASZ90_004239 [hydrocarbon metagenome]|uniref:Amidoligase enzyme n=1 Tax=hydrocarbon metagenome TaxID=938273 RepID=A0A0W8FZ23_9ZZZZ